MHGFKTDPGARTTAGHGFVQNIHRGHYELRAEEPLNLRVTAAFDELALTIWQPGDQRSRLSQLRATQQPPAKTV